MKNYYKIPKSDEAKIYISNYFGKRLDYHLYNVQSDHSALQWAVELEKLFAKPFFRITDEKEKYLVKKKENIMIVSRYFTQICEEPPVKIVLIDYKKAESTPIFNFDNYNFLLLMICNNEYPLDEYKQKIMQLDPHVLDTEMNAILSSFQDTEESNNKKDTDLPKDENSIFIFNVVNGSMTALASFQEQQRTRLLYTNPEMATKYPYSGGNEKCEEYLSYLQKDVSYE
jgi:hypothetical protein